LNELLEALFVGVDEDQVNFPSRDPGGVQGSQGGDSEVNRDDDNCGFVDENPLGM